MSTLTVGELFAGIGGFGLGFRRAGIDHAFAVEWDTGCQDVLSRHFPTVPLFSDVRDVGAHNLSPCDVLTFGSPCQDLSTAGKGAGLAGERSGLFFEAVRVIRELREAYERPTITVWENVVGALTSSNGLDFAAALDSLAECGAMDLAWGVLDAQFFGVAQGRRRVFVVADFGGERAGAIHFDAGRVRHAPTASRGPGQALAGAPRGASQEPDGALDELPIPINDGRNIEKAEARLGVRRPGAPAFTVDTLGTQAVYWRDRVRFLTPTEYGRLQGFPDDWNDWLPDRTRYRQFGNAVAVPVAEWLGRRIVEVAS